MQNPIIDNNTNATDAVIVYMDSETSEQDTFRYMSPNPLSAHELITAFTEYGKQQVNGEDLGEVYTSVVFLDPEPFLDNSTGPVISFIVRLDQPRMRLTHTFITGFVYLNHLRIDLDPVTHPDLLPA